MEKDQPFLEKWILPRFDIDGLNTVEWGEWTSGIWETAFIQVKINGIQYILAQDSSGQVFPRGEPKDWLRKYLFEIELRERRKLPFQPTDAVRTRRETTIGNYSTNYGVKLTDEDLFPLEYNAQPNRKKKFKNYESPYMDWFMLFKQ